MQNAPEPISCFLLLAISSNHYQIKELDSVLKGQVPHIKNILHMFRVLDSGLQSLFHVM